MALVSLQNITLAFGGPRLLDDATLHIERGERVCLVGRNGEGKSTLMGILSGDIRPDQGERVIQSGVQVASLPQAVPDELTGSVRSIVMSGVREHRDEWEAVQHVEELLSRLDLEADTEFSSMSGGQKRRVLLARALVGEPEVLALDEPTNHLDIDSIRWLESHLQRHRGGLIFVTHDRAFLRALATRIVELDRGVLKSWACGYDRFLELRQVALEAEEKHRALFDKKLAQEETWLRKGIKARRTRNEGRVRALLKLRDERRIRRDRPDTARIGLQQSALSGRKVIEAVGVSYAWGTTPVIADFSTLIMRGDKVGILGPNGCGKSTLIRVLLGQLAPQCGTIELGTGLQIAYFDQHRTAIDGKKTVAENVGEGNEYVLFNGKKRHIMSYLEDFLFESSRSRTPARVLSGGERNRLLLAKLFTRPSNLIIMDEPTNDLDAETLELLEDLLVEYEGTLLLVSHDREFINQVATSTLVFEGEGRIGDYAGGYDDWLSQKASAQSILAGASSALQASSTVRSIALAPLVTTKKLTNKEREELALLPARIEAMEAELANLEAKLADAAFFKKGGDEVKKATERAGKLPHLIEQAYAMWHGLEARS